MNSIELNSVSKKYIISHEKGSLVRNILPSFFRIKYREEFWALKDINFKLNKGEALGVIGPNGAGKSTLLNIIGGITSPTHGSVKTRGRVSAILTLGAGFHPELTGEENIFLNATILGMNLNETKKKFDSILSFSELYDFIDAPLQTYSTGMMMRLGFSVAIHMDFDILLIDEILSVGDLHFQQKCIDRIKIFRKQGKVLIVSSQSLGLVESLTDKALLLVEGKPAAFGKCDVVTKQYEGVFKEQGGASVEHDVDRLIKDKMDRENPARVKMSWGKAYGTKDAEITKLRFLNKNGAERYSFGIGEDVKVEVHFRVNKEVNNPHFGVAIFREDHVYCYGPNTEFDGIVFDRLKKGNRRFCINYPRLKLSPGTYFLSVAIWDREENEPYDYHCACHKIVIKGKRDGALYREQYSFRKENIGDKKTTNNSMALELRNGFNEPQKVFKTGEPFNLYIDFFSNRVKSDILLDVSRDDNVVCFKMKKTVIGKGRHRIKAEIPKLNLLTGNYSISLRGITNALYNFMVIALKKDHGMVYLDHRWELEAEDEKGNNDPQCKRSCS